MRSRIRWRVCSSSRKLLAWFSHYKNKLMGYANKAKNVCRYPFKVMEVFLQGFFSPSMRRLVGYIRILFIAWATIIFRPVSFPIAQAHPAKVMFTSITLHVVTTTVLFYTNLALGAHLIAMKKISLTLMKRTNNSAYFSMSRDVVGRFAIICTLGQPLPNGFAIGRSVIFTSTSKTK